MPLNQSSFQYLPGYIEGTVASVDPKRYVCNVKTLNGQILTDVPWLSPVGGSVDGGLHFTPNLDDRVLIYTGLTYPIIIGSLSRIGKPNEFTPDIGVGSLSLDPGTSSPLGNGNILNPGKPTDFASGDFIYTNKRGGLFGVLKDATVVIRSSRVCQMIFSRYEDAVKIIARNYERVSDLSQEVVANLYGRLYRYYGFNRDLDKSVLGDYEYEEIHGDVAAGEYGKAEPFGMPKPVPAADTRIRKSVVYDNAGKAVHTETLKKDGNLVIEINQIVSGPSSKEDRQDDLIMNEVTTSSTHSRITITPTYIKIDFDNEAHATFDNSGINMQAKGHFAVIDSTGVHLG